MSQSAVQRPLLDPFVKEIGRPVRGHIVELDSLRGVAALIVVFDHFARFWVETSHPVWMNHVREFPLSFLVNGRSAVILFFMLSGFVLTLPALGGRPQPYPVYAVRRICRIYLPYLAALALAVAGCWRLYGHRMYGHEFASMWHSAPDLHTIGQHILFLGRFDVFAYDPPIWSLVHEMRVSLVFPLLCLVSLRLRAWAAFGIAVGLPAAAGLMERGTHLQVVVDPARSSLDWRQTLGYCGIFLLGSLVARYEESLRTRLARVPGLPLWAGLAVAVSLYQFPGKLHVPWPIQDFATGMGAGYLMVLGLMQHGWLSRVLHRRELRFLGRISYSFYLLHLPILLAISIAVYGRVEYGYVLLPFLAVSMMAAAVFYRLVEVPSIELGRRIGRRARTSA